MIFDWPEQKTGTEVQFAAVSLTNFKLGNAIQKTPTCWGVPTSMAHEVTEVTLNFIKENKSIFKELSKL